MVRGLLPRGAGLGKGRELKLLVAARHPGAAVAAVALATAIVRRGVETEFFATEPARSRLVGAALGPVCSFAASRERYPALSPYVGPERIENEDMLRGDRAVTAIDTMARWLGAYLEASKPDAVVMMDANEQLGADQVLAVAARRLGIPSVRVRDSWGIATGVETAAMRGVLPERLREAGRAARYFEIDRHGAALSVASLGIPADRIAVLNGLVTLDRLVGALTPETRAAARAAIDVAPDEPLIVYFTQPTRRESAEEAAFEAFVAQLNAAGLGPRGVLLATQEHPRENDPADGRLGLGWTARYAERAYRGRVIDLTPKVVMERTIPFDHTMLMADVFASSYSNSSIEATALGATASAGIPAGQRSIGFHTLCPDAVTTVMAERRAGLRRLPFAECGALPYADGCDLIGARISELLFSPPARERYFHSLRATYSPGTCAPRLLDGILGLVRSLPVEATAP